MEKRLMLFSATHIFVFFPATIFLASEVVTVEAGLFSSEFTRV